MIALGLLDRTLDDHLAEITSRGLLTDIYTRGCPMQDECTIMVEKKLYRVTFSRPLSASELRRLSVIRFAGSVDTLADVRRVLEGGLTILKVQTGARLAVLKVREDNPVGRVTRREWVAECRAPGDGPWYRVNRMEPDTVDACHALITRKKSLVRPPPVEYQIRNVYMGEILPPGSAAPVHAVQPARA